MYKELDRNLVEKREFYRSQAEQYPVLEDVIRGRKSLGLLALGLQVVVLKDGFRALPDAIIILQYGALHTEYFTIPYPGELFPFVEMLSDLLKEQATGNIDYKHLLDDILAGEVNLFAQQQLRERLKYFFLSLIGSAVALDRNVHMSFMDILVQENPELFKEEYARMNATDREYAEYTLSRMLSAGLLEMDEIELERIIRETRAQAGRDDDGAE